MWISRRIHQASKEVHARLEGIASNKAFQPTSKNGARLNFGVEMKAVADSLKLLQFAIAHFPFSFPSHLAPLKPTTPRSFRLGEWLFPLKM
jgi:hypothetical protein